MPLLDQLRAYNHAIGSYDKSMLTDSFDYSVKLSNGLIRLPFELVQDYENSPNSITSARYQLAANQFQPSTPISSAPGPVDYASPQEPETKGGNNIIRNIIVAFIVVLGAIVLISQLRGYAEKRAEDAQKAQIRANIRAYVTATGSSFQYRLIGGISGFSVTVNNNTDYTIDMVKVRVAYIKQAGGVYKYEDVEFPNLSPHSDATLPAPDSDRGTSVQLEIETITSTELGL